MARPLNPGKNKRGGLGFKGWRSSFPIRPGFKPGFFGGLQYATNNPAVLYSAILNYGNYLGSPSCVGYGCFHARSRQHHGQAHAVIF